MHLQDEPVADAAAIAQRLCGSPVDAAERCGGGGNNRVYRIVTAGDTYALKCYAPAGVDDRDRLRHEFDGLRFLAANGMRGVVPAALAVDRDARCALYSWIDGTAVATHASGDIAALLDFMAALQAARSAPGSDTLLPAAEAVVRRSDLLEQIDRRVERLTAVAPAEPELERFLNAELRPEVARLTAALRSAATATAAVAPRYRTLSPSDFGFHNALRRPDGTLAFIDFEYFGWDDPVKLTADVLWHPAMRLSRAQRRRFIDGAHDLYGADPAFDARLRAYFPLFGIRWILIVLNEFVPQIWERRAFADNAADLAAAKARQLRKAQALCESLRSTPQGELPL